MADSPLLLCYDGSPGARAAIAAAGALMPGRRAVVLCVGPLGLVAEARAAEGSADELERRAHDDALMLARDGADLAGAAGFRARARAAVETPIWRAVISVADEVGAAAIVLGSRGLIAVRELVEGSLSHEVAERAGRPVLVVPSGK